MAATLYIGTPTYRGEVHTGYVSSLVRMIADLSRNGIGVTYADPSDGTVIDVQRDKIAKDFLESKATHLLAIDSDMKFEPSLARKLLSTGKDFIGALYTKRAIKLETLRSLQNRGVDFDSAMALSHDFACGNVIGGGGDVYEADAVGMGFTLIARSVFDRVEAEPYDHNGPLIGYFATFNENGIRIHEDLAFCARYRKAGGKIYGYASGNISHIGIMEYGVTFAAYVKARQKVQPA